MRAEKALGVLYLKERAGLVHWLCAEGRRVDELGRSWRIRARGSGAWASTGGAAGRGLEDEEGAAPIDGRRGGTARRQCCTARHCAVRRAVGRPRGASGGGGRRTSAWGSGWSGERGF